MPKIENIEANIVSNSGGTDTIGVTIKSGEFYASASVPQGVSTGEDEVVNLKAEKALNSIKDKIAPEIVGKNFENQYDFDNFLEKLDGTENLSELGGNSILCLSIAFSRLSSIMRNIPLWKYLSETFNTSPDFPRLFANTIGGGLHGNTNLDIQEYLLIPEERDPSRAREDIENIYKKAKEIISKEVSDITSDDEGAIEIETADRIKPLKILRDASVGINVSFGIDVAADNVKELETLEEFYKKACSDFPLIYIEDPYPENDVEHFVKMITKFPNILICGDDLTVTNPEKIEVMSKGSAINSVIIKPNQIGTVTKTFKAKEVSDINNLEIIVSHRGMETEDSFISDLAYAMGAHGMKIGVPVQKERIAKYDRLQEIKLESD